MKNTVRFIAFFTGVFLFASCNDKIKETYKVNTPIYMSYEDLRSSFKVAGGEKIIQPGKIYFKDDFIFVNEYQKGIHVIDNADPSNPQIIKFIEIPGNVDMAIKGNLLYADSYVDLLTIDISDINNIKEVDRDTNAFPYVIPEIETGTILEPVIESHGVITGYTVTEKTEDITSDNNNYIRYPMWTEDVFMNAASVSGAKTETTGTGSVGTGGSMARFTIYDDYLYAINNSSLKLFNISDLTDPTFEKDIYISWRIETIFPYEQKLFIGGQQGMYVYSIQNPALPEFISEFRHASACDPVVVSGDLAYVTLRSGNLCGAAESQLNVIDISNLESPVLIKEYTMQEPYGLGIDDSILFVCDGDAGLKIYNAFDPLAIDSNQIKVYPDVQAFDVIPLGNVLLMIGVDGLYQYDYSNLADIKQLSHIPIYDN